MSARHAPKHAAPTSRIRRHVRGTTAAFARRLHGARHSARVLVATLTAVLTVITGFAFAVPASAAPPVYEINGHWVNPPDTIKSGDPAVAEWRVNVNDAANPPSNDPVDNVVATFTTGETGKAFFQDIPDMCKKTGVDPVSSISPDGLTLTCNLGTVKMGTAVVVQTPVVANGVTGDEVSLTGTSPSGEDVDLPHIPIKNNFGLDIAYGGNASYAVWDDVNDPHFVDTDVEWSLRLQKGSDPGRQSITYHLTVTDSNGSPVNVGIHPDFKRDPTKFDDGKPGCTHFDADNADGHPWSRSRDIPNDQRSTNFVDTCTLTRTGTGTFDLTLSGIDYNPTHLPTLDSSSRGLPPAWNYIASGSLWFRVATDQAGSITVHSDAPHYTSTTGLPSDDLPGNNITTKTYTLPGNFASAWARPYTGSGGTSWDDSYTVSPGTTIMALTNVNGGASSPGTTGIYGDCLTWSPQSLTYQGDLSDPDDPSGNYQAQVIGYDAAAGDPPGPLNNPPAVEYFTGNVGDPDQFDCGSGTWSTTPPANLASVHAIRIRYNHALFAAEDRVGIRLNAWLRVNNNVTSGTDIWEFGSELRGEGTWLGPTAGNQITPTPNADYPYTTGRRDIVRIAIADPFIRKSSPSTTVTAGVPADFTLTYSANGSGIIPPSVDDYVIRDVLPPHMTYVAGSASAGEPALSTNANGQQVLTWTLDGVTTNETHTLTYQAQADNTVPPGTQLTNSATATFDGTTTDPATKTVTTTSNGFTQIGKTADTPFIPNLDGDGSGTGSWTVTVSSSDPIPQPFTDTIDILPYEGDGRGTSFSGSYTLNQITAPAGATVYYTTADPATLSDDPSDGSNGSAPGNVTGNTAGWTTTYDAGATAIRVIGGTLASGGTLQFQVPITTTGATPEDVYVNRAQAIAAHTALVMRTSAKMTIAHHYAAMLKKEVQDVNGKWHDANAAADAPAFHYGDTIHYRVTVTNVGDGTLTDLDITDDKQPQLGQFHIDTLASGKSQSHEYSIKLGTSLDGNQKNTACATAAIPPDMTEAPKINCDPAIFKVSNYVTTKVANPATGKAVQPGQVIHYTIAVTQQGNAPADAVFSDDLSKLLDDADYNNDAKADIGAVIHKGKTLGWTGTVPVGEVAHVTYSITVHDKAHLGDTDLLNPVTSPGCVPEDGQFPDCTTDHKTGYFTYDKVADPKSGTTLNSGDTVKYTITVTQHGQAELPGASIKDDMNKALDDATYGKDAKASSGRVSYHSPNLAWKGDLAVGQKVKITYTMSVTGNGDSRLANVVTSTDPRGSCNEDVGCDTEHPLNEAAGLAATGGNLEQQLILVALLLGAGGALTFTATRRRRTE